VGIAVAAGVVAGVAIGIVVREALRARARTASEAHASARVQVEVEAAASSPSAGARLRPLAHALGLALLGIGVMLGVSALAAQLAHALPLHEIGTHPRIVPAAVATLGGLALIALGSLTRRPLRRHWTAPPLERTGRVETDGAVATTWQDAA
jgi:Na+/glutamate symporter